MGNDEWLTWPRQDLISGRHGFTEWSSSGSCCHWFGYNSIYLYSLTSCSIIIEQGLMSHGCDDSYSNFLPWIHVYFGETADPTDWFWNQLDRLWWSEYTFRENSLRLSDSDLYKTTRQSVLFLSEKRTKFCLLPFKLMRRLILGSPR